MRKAKTRDDRGAALIGYALLVMLVAIAGTVSLASVGNKTSDAFEQIPQAVGQLSPGSTTTTTTEPELTPSEKWSKAKDDYNSALEDAKARKADEIATAKTQYQQKVADNKAKPKAERKKANQEAKAQFKTAKANANSTYKESVQAAKDAKAAAKAEYLATK